MNLISILGILGAALAAPGELAYIDSGAGNGGAVSIVHVDTGAATQVGPGRADGPPHWSPDGTWLAFETATPEGGRGIYVVRHDGQEGKPIGAPDTWNTAPCWSPSGTHLLFVSAPAAGVPGQLHAHDLNTGETAVWGGARAGLAAPQWLPYTLLLLALNPDAAPEIGGVAMESLVEEARMTLEELQADALPEAAVAMMLTAADSEDGLAVNTEIVLVTKSYVLPLAALPDLARMRADALVWGVTANWEGASIEPESGRSFGAYTFDDPGSSTRVAFESNEGGDREIYVLGKRGIANVSNHRSADWNPVWAPDGKKLAFESFREGRRGVYTVYADTAHVTSLASEPGADSWSPAWSQNGRHLAYVSDATGKAELYVLNVEEGESTLLSVGGGAKEAPAWRPYFD